MTAKLTQVSSHGSFVTMTAEWRPVPDSNLEVSNDGRVRRDGVETVPCLDGCGYRHICVNGMKVLLHRLIAIAFIPNPEAKPCIDHANGDPLNNSVENLRWATHAENMRNRKAYKKASDLPRGVKMSGERFMARIGYNGERHYIGTFDTAEEASLHYEAHAVMMHGDFCYSVQNDGGDGKSDDTISHEEEL